VSKRCLALVLITIYCVIIAAATVIIASELIFIVICCVQTMSEAEQQQIKQRIAELIAQGDKQKVAEAKALWELNLY
jgi:nitrate/nitrite transporter NarK